MMYILLSLERTVDQSLVEHAWTRKEYAEARGERRIKWVAPVLDTTVYYSVIWTLAL